MNSEGTLAAPLEPPHATPPVRGLRPGELVAMGELIYQRVFSLAVWGIGLAAAMASVAAIGRTREADLPRTAALAALLLAMSVLLGRNAPRIYRAMRRRPALSLIPAGRSPNSQPASCR